MKFYAIKNPKGEWVEDAVATTEHDAWEYAGDTDHDFPRHPEYPLSESGEAAGYCCVEVEMVKAGGRVCEWTEDTEGTFVTSCGNYFQFTADGPKENKFQFCPYCGGKIVEAQGGKKEGGK